MGADEPRFALVANEAKLKECQTIKTGPSPKAPRPPNPHQSPRDARDSIVERGRGRPVTADPATKPEQEPLQGHVGREIGQSPGSRPALAAVGDQEPRAVFLDHGG